MTYVGFGRQYESAKKDKTQRNGFFVPGFPISRSKLELFLNCPRCFFIDRRFGVSRPPGFPFSINSCVDTLLKREFDHYRDLAVSHPLMIEYGIQAIPYSHPQMNFWRDSLHSGLSYHHPMTDFVVTGAVDDLWINPAGEVIFVMTSPEGAAIDKIFIYVQGDGP